MKILLPTDFSENAQLAAGFAIDIAQKSHGHIQVFHAYEVPHYERVMTTSLLEEMKKSAERNMLDFDSNFLKNQGANYSTRIAVGNPIRMTRELAQQNQVDIIVMGTRGASGIEEFLIGSNTESVIHNVDVPVLVIPPKSVRKAFKTIVLATDLDLKGKERPLQRLKNFAKEFDAKIEVLHFQRGDQEKANRAFVEKHLEDVSHSYSRMDEKGNLDAAILKHCDTKNADLVAVIARQKNFFESLFQKSLTSDMAYHTHLPMLALHEPK